MTVGPDHAFVIQQHTTLQGVHWDLMLQMGDVLWTWRITFSPEQIDVISLPIERIFDHPLRFLSYEGPVQNKTGQVKIADKGDFRLISEGADELCIDVRGNILQGICILTRQTDNLWMLARRGSI